MGVEWAEKRRAAGRAHKATYREGMDALSGGIGQPRCRLCHEPIEGILVSVIGVSVGSAYYHEACYDQRWESIIHRLR